VSGKLKAAKSEAEVEDLAKSIPDVLSGAATVELPTTFKENEKEDAVRDIINKMKEALAISGDTGLDFQSKFFDWMSCQPGHTLHPVCHLNASRL
jgi:hypothetical protein